MSAIGAFFAYDWLTCIVPDASWWLLHGMQDLALTAAMALAYGGSRRVGAHTPYGQMLFLLALGFWLLLLGEFAFLVRNALGTWKGPGGLPDLLALPGWLLLVLSVTLFVTRFRPAMHGGSRWRLVYWVSASVATIGVLFVTWLSPPGADPDAGVRAAYLAIDAIGIGVLLYGVERLHRMRRSALGRLYVMLGTALIVKSIGDIYWAYLAAREAGSLLATMFYPLAGLIALVGLAMHHWDLRGETLDGAPLGMPWMHPRQMYLRDAGRRMQEVAGGYAAKSYLEAAAQVFARHGVSWEISEGVLEVGRGADAAMWADAVQAADGFAWRHFGEAGRNALKALQKPGGLSE